MKFKKLKTGLLALAAALTAVTAPLSDTPLIAENNANVAQAATTVITGGSSRETAVPVEFGVEYGATVQPDSPQWFSFTTNGSDDYYYSLWTKCIDAYYCGSTIQDFFGEKHHEANYIYNGKENYFIDKSFEANGTYYIGIWVSKPGNVKFTVSDVYDDYTDIKENAEEIKFGAEIEGELQCNQDVDWVKFNSGNRDKFKLTVDNISVYELNCGVYDAFGECVVDGKYLYSPKTGIYDVPVEPNTVYYLAVSSSFQKYSGKYKYHFECYHNFVNDEVVQPTYTDGGYTIQKCTSCGETQKVFLTPKKKVSYPTGLKISKKAKTALTVKWNKVSGVDGYQVQQKVGGKWKTVKTISKNTTTKYKASKLRKNKTYKFRVRAFVTSGNNQYYSNFITVSGKTKK